MKTRPLLFSSDGRANKEKRERLLSLLPLATVLFSLLFNESLSVLLLSVGAVLFHELGHLLAFYLFLPLAPSLHATGAGLRLYTRVPIPPLAMTFILLCGPVSNLTVALLALRFGTGDFALLLAAVHLLYGIFNLLPFGKSDGERLLSLFFLSVFPQRGKKIARVISFAFLSLFFYFSLFLYFLSGSGLCGLLLSLFFFFNTENG